MPATSVTDARLLRRKLDIADMLGPATLAYLDPAGFRPQPDLSVIEQFGARDPLLRRFLSQADTQDLRESGIEQITSPAFAIREEAEIITAAGYRDWPGSAGFLTDRCPLRSKETQATVHSHIAPGVGTMPTGVGASVGWLLWLPRAWQLILYGAGSRSLSGRLGWPRR